MTRVATAAEPEGACSRRVVFHRGALGDSVLLWPMLRAWRAEGVDVTLVTDRSKALLAASELRIRGEDAETPRYNRLWAPDSTFAKEELVRDVSLVLSYGADSSGTWASNAGRLFPGATIRVRSERPDRVAALGHPLPAPNPCDPGAIVCHIGAGSEDKRWPLAQWLALADAFGPRRRIRLIAGEVERERLREQRQFVSAGGEFLNTLEELVLAIRSARVFIAADSGPGHLAAQLGVPTVSLFGPTDPAQWAPVGPLCALLAPPVPSNMGWLNPGLVQETIAELSRTVYGRRG